RSEVVKAKLAALAFVFICGCATINATTTPYVGAPRFAPSKPEAVEILGEEPAKPHDRLGEIILDASVDPSPPGEELEARIRREAANLGANAIFIVWDHVQPVGMYVSGPWWGGQMNSIPGHKVVGVAIRYR